MRDSWIPNLKLRGPNLSRVYLYWQSKVIRLGENSDGSNDQAVSRHVAVGRTLDAERDPDSLLRVDVELPQHRRELEEVTKPIDKTVC